MPTKTIAWTTGTGNITLTYTGQGDGTILVSSDDNTGAARSQTITIQTTAGSPVVTRNITINQAAYVPPIQNFAYTGTVQSCTLPAGTYRLQCWGAQGGSNTADATYGITAQAGGKGGYSEGILVLSSATTVYIYVGGQGGNSAGGYNGGGSTQGSSTYDASGELGVSKMAGGGGGTDIRLTSDSLLSRFIVAGGGSGGAMGYQKVTTWNTLGTIDCNVSSGSTGTFNGHSYTINKNTRTQVNISGNPISYGTVVRVTISGASSGSTWQIYWTANSTTQSILSASSTLSRTYTHNYDSNPCGSGGYYRIQVNSVFDGTITVEEQTITETTQGQVGYYGGGTTGDGLSNSYKGKQNAAGTGGAFGIGSTGTLSTYRYCSAGGGGGWYGGGGGRASNTMMNFITASGGGSGFVNIPDNASYRPTDYTGIELDSGATHNGGMSNPSTTDGTYETGHAGNGYARITRMGSWKAELPSGYTLLEYIENTDSAYINTGVNAANDIGIHIEYEDNYSYGSVSNYVVGARASSSSTILYALSGSSSGNTTNIVYNGTGANLNITRTQGKKYVVDLQADSTGLYYRSVVDGSDAKTGKITKTLSASSTPICLFGFNSSNIKRNTRISRFYITGGGDVVRFFLPCKNASNVVGLYDCVNGVFYGSANSNTFTAGPNV